LSFPDTFVFPDFGRAEIFADFLKDFRSGTPYSRERLDAAEPQTTKEEIPLTKERRNANDECRRLTP
jgi:hypothetical protein